MQFSKGDGHHNIGCVGYGGPFNLRCESGLFDLPLQNVSSKNTCILDKKNLGDWIILLSQPKFWSGVAFLHTIHSIFKKNSMDA